MKTYKIKDKRREGRLYKYISFKGFDTSWTPEDKDAEKRAIKAADLYIIKNNLKMETKLIKKV